MAKIFENVRFKKPNYSAFDLSREQKLSFKMGDLIPTYLEEVVPGDHFKVKTEMMLRLAPMLAPIMHRVNVHMHYFFVPNRLVWTQWENFITGGKDGITNPTLPTFNYNNSAFRDAKLPDYMGLPTGINVDLQVSQLPFRAYQLIYNTYYRDETLNDAVDINDSTNVVQLCTVRKRSWEKDYFTSALPFTQRGPEVGIPIDIETKDQADLNVTPPGAGDLRYDIDGKIVLQDGTTPAGINTIENTSLDFTINELRKSSALQRWLEKQATGGYRYIETILSHFGVRAEDYRLQRPEYLGGGRQPIVISEVLNTTGTAEAPQGDMAGHGISVGTANEFTKHFKEHGYVIGIMSVIPKTAYQQGVPRTFRRFDRYEYYWPEFANLGEQEVKNWELYIDTNAINNDATFGYQQRYAEYKYGQSTVHGDFRNTLKFWHMGRIFASRPALNASFIAADPTTRIFAVETGDTIWAQLYHDVKARRPMPYFADPRLS